MAHIADALEEEWDPDMFKKKRWDPRPRPEYFTPIPTRASLAEKGIAVPKRMA
jgi:hypothetical protein